MLKDKKKLFKILTSLYKKFFNTINFFSTSILKFFLFVMSYKQAILLCLKKTNLLSSLISLSKKKNFFLKFFSTNFNCFNKFCIFDNFIFFNKKNKIIKNTFLLNINNDKKNNNLMFYISKLFSIVPFYNSLRILDVVISFMFIYFYNKIRDLFILDFSNMINLFFEINLFFPIPVLKRNVNKYTFIYNIVNDNNVVNNKNYYHYFTLKYISYYFDRHEFIGNVFRRNTFMYKVTPFYLFFLQNFCKKKDIIFCSLLVMLYIWPDTSNYMCELEKERWRTYGMYEKEIFRYHKSPNAFWGPEVSYKYSEMDTKLLK